jgi:hypothetical protein
VKLNSDLMRVLILVGCLIVSGFGTCLDAAEKKIPFHPGEKLTFQVKWLFIPAAEAVLEIMPIEMVNGIRSFHFSLTMKTYEVVDLIYKVRDRLDAYTDEAITRSLLYKERAEGKNKKNVTITFHWDRLEAQYSNFDETNQPIPIQPGSFDLLSVYYAFRLMDLKEGVELRAPVTDGKKCVIGKAKVVKREKIEVRGVLYDTFLVEPSMEHIKGVFEKTKNAKLQLWVTADEARIPVRAKSEVVVGSFVAELVSAQSAPPKTFSSFPDLAATQARPVE